MSRRPQRRAAAKKVTYSYDSESEDDHDKSEDPSSGTDSEDDPDEVEIPGGGKNLKSIPKLKIDLKRIDRLVDKKGNDSKEKNTNSNLLEGAGEVSSENIPKTESMDDKSKVKDSLSKLATAVENQKSLPPSVHNATNVENGQESILKEQLRSKLNPIFNAENGLLKMEPQAGANSAGNGNRKAELPSANTLLREQLMKSNQYPTLDHNKINASFNKKMGVGGPSDMNFFNQNSNFPSFNNIPPHVMYPTLSGLSGASGSISPALQYWHQMLSMKLGGAGNSPMMSGIGDPLSHNPFLMAATNSGDGARWLTQMMASATGNATPAPFMMPNYPAAMPPMSQKQLKDLWLFNKPGHVKLLMPPQQQEEEGEEEDDYLAVAETYADYMPAKLKLGIKHPDPVVETASLSSVEPCDVWYTLSLPEECIDSGALSALQLEAITYASQQHEHFLPDGSRAGFLIGDGAGVGKGRTIAGVIFENFLKGRKKALWISVSNDLKYDSERDLSDIGATKVDVFPLNKLKYAKINSPTNGNIRAGVIFSTYSALIGESSQGSGRYKSRLKQLLQWCGDDFDGPIIFDECHRAKNLCPVGSTKPTKTGLTVLELQKQLPNARIVYASATGASEPRNMAYMTRLGMWGEGSPFLEFMDFINAVEKRGVGAMEIVAMDMKLRGMYIARQLSFHGVTFRIEEVPLNEQFNKMYDDSVALWVSLMQKFQEAAELIEADKRMRKTMWGQFWSSHQRFFKYLCIAAKVEHAVNIARESIKLGKCVVIGLQSTGEARTLEQLDKDDGELSDFVSTAKGVLQALVEKHFPAPDRTKINRLLGRSDPKEETKKKSDDNEEEFRKAVNGVKDIDAGYSLKRQSARQAAVKLQRKKKKNSSDSESDKASNDSDFKMTDDESPSESEESESEVPSSEISEESDLSDDWGSSKKRKKKPLANAAKKRHTTQDKIRDILEGRLEPGGKKGMVMPPSAERVTRACELKEELLKEVESLGERLPPNTLDQLIDELGGPENVAEMTGRKGRVVQTDAGIVYESRSEADSPLETLNLIEKQRFMDGEKDVAIISEAASSGISLQSDRRVKNQRRRVHITLELPWSADRAIQQFGRTHRSNQVNAPEYIFLISDLAGERRFASIVAKRLESLGALTHGDRRATETRDLSRYNIDNKYGRTALETTMKAIMGYEAPMVPSPSDYKGDFFQDVADALVGVGMIVNSENSPGILSLDKDYNNISKFLNRILGMPVELQNRLFQYFTDTLQAIITAAKKSGRYDLGILDLGVAGDNVMRSKLYKYVRKHTTGIATTEIHIVHAERGLSWEDATAKLDARMHEHEENNTKEKCKDGFWLSHQIRNNKATAILALQMDEKPGRRSEIINKKTMFAVYRPNTGFQLRPESLAELEKKYKKVKTEEAETPWKSQYESSEKTCSHAYWRGNCKNISLGLDCEIGLRRRTYNVLAGSVLSVWARVENILTTETGQNSKMQVIRLRTAEGDKIVGTLIPNSCIEKLKEALASDAESTKEETF